MHTAPLCEVSFLHSKVCARIQSFVFPQVYPFVRQLRLWIKRNKRRAEKKPRVRQRGNGRQAGTLPPSGGDQPSAVEEGAVQPETTHVAAEPVPGQSWTKFRFRHDEIVQHLLTG
jgi:hypothetical protein